MRHYFSWLNLCVIFSISGLIACSKSGEDNSNGVSSAAVIRFDANGATSGAPPAEITSSTGSIVSIPGQGALLRTGFAWGGWNSKSDGSGNTYSGSYQVLSAGTLNLFAKWINNTFTVTYNGNGNTSGTVPVDSNTYIGGTNATVLGNTGSLAIGAGFEFLGWEPGSTYSAPVDFVAGNLMNMTANRTLYAAWSQPAWTGVAMSADGAKIFAVGTNSRIWVSTDSGATWIQRDSARGWSAIASSSDGTKVVAVVSGGQIYTSTDSGSTWTVRGTSQSYASVASSSDGSTLVAGVTGSSSVYTSSDFGVTWTIRGAGGGTSTWGMTSVSSDGTRMIYSNNTGNAISASTNSGVNWAYLTNSPYATHRAIFMSAAGTFLVTCLANGQIHTSSDSGTTWTARDSARNWIAIAGSTDGVKLIAAVQNGQLYTSADSGASWTARESSRDWRAVASSSDGTKLTALAYSGRLYTSGDSGASWLAR